MKGIISKKAEFWTSGLDFDSDLSAFPQTWLIGDDSLSVTMQVGADSIETEIPLEKLINKHVFLALKEYTTNALDIEEWIREECNGYQGKIYNKADCLELATKLEQCAVLLRTAAEQPERSD